MAGSPVDLLHHPPLALAGDRLARQRRERGRDVGHEFLALVLCLRHGGRGELLALRHRERHGRLAAHLRRVVGEPLAERDNRAQVVVAGPFGQVGGGALAVVLERRLAGRERDPDDEDAEQRRDDPDGRPAEEPAGAAEPDLSGAPAEPGPAPSPASAAAAARQPAWRLRGLASPAQGPAPGPARSGSGSSSVGPEVNRPAADRELRLPRAPAGLARCLGLERRQAQLMTCIFTSPPRPITPGRLPA